MTLQLAADELVDDHVNAGRSPGEWPLRTVPRSTPQLLGRLQDLQKVTLAPFPGLKGVVCWHGKAVEFCAG